MARLTNELNLTEYGKHRGCSKVAVFKAIAKGRITARIDEEGNKWINPITADAEWLQSTKVNNTAKLVPVNKLKVGRPKKTDIEARKLVKEARKAAEAEARAKKKALEAEKKNPADVELSKSIAAPKRSVAVIDDELDLKELSMAAREQIARVIKMEASAEREHLALAREKKELVLADEFEDLFSAKIAKARDSLLHLPKAFRVAFQELDATYSEWLNDRIKSILNDLANDEISND